jgi:hypothetical protein
MFRANLRDQRSVPIRKFSRYDACHGCADAKSVGQSVASRPPYCEIVVHQWGREFQVRMRPKMRVRSIDPGADDSPNNAIAIGTKSLSRLICFNGAN